VYGRGFEIPSDEEPLAEGMLVDTDEVDAETDTDLLAEVDAEAATIVGVLA
jgi:hypothetical protein